MTTRLSGAGSSSGGFRITGQPALSRSTANRDESLRVNDDLLAATWNDARLLVLDTHLRAKVLDGISLEWHEAVALGDKPHPDAVLLGEQDEIMYWAIQLIDEDHPDWSDLRMSGALLDDTDAGLFTTAVGLLHWHEDAQFCAGCGTAVEYVRAGWASACPNCQREDYPRTDPAVIVLVHDGEDQVLLARQPSWPSRRFSVLAGFVETGESLEACVKREVLEEVGVAVRDPRYLASQPWPFPRSLMIAFSAVADPHLPLRPADGEIAEAHWVPRSMIAAALRTGPTEDGLILPPETSIAHRMLESWAGMQF